MSDFSAQPSDSEYLHLLPLSPETREALSDSARRNGRSVHEEAEHIIKSHLAAFGEDDD